jgi:uncharacterized membrane protein YdjX (TVP38/TMEM64 family)
MKRLLGLGLLGVITVLTLFLLWPQFATISSSVEQVRTWVLGFGVFAPLAFVLMQALQIVIAPIPGYLVGAAGGYLFGIWVGTSLSIVGTIIGASLAFGLARQVGQPLMAKLLPMEHLTKWERLASTNSIFTWMLVLALPFGDVPYFVAGLSDLPLRKLLLATVIVRSAGIFLSVLVGAHGGDLPDQVMPLVVGVIFLLTLGAFLTKDRLEDLLTRHIFKRLR